MRHLTPLLALFAVPVCAIAQQAAYPEVTLPGTEERPLVSEINGREYLLYISYPPSYDSEPERKFPVVYFLDGYWDFPLVRSTFYNLLYDEQVPEAILVGIGYKDKLADYGAERSIDLTPTNDAGPHNAGKTGGGPAFLQVIAEEIIPYVEQNLRGNPDYRVLGGSSLGGIFTLYAMYEQPERFNAYAAISPAVPWDHRWIFREEALLRDKARDEGTTVHLPARLYMSAAEKEWEWFFADIMAFDQILQHAKYEDFEYEFRLVDGERHAGTKAESWTRALRYTLEPWRKLHPPPPAGG